VPEDKVSDMAEVNTLQANRNQDVGNTTVGFVEDINSEEEVEKNLKANMNSEAKEQTWSVKAADLVLRGPETVLDSNVEPEAVVLDSAVKV
jgi:hypothetical protein